MSAALRMKTRMNGSKIVNEAQESKRDSPKFDGNNRQNNIGIAEESNQGDRGRECEKTQKGQYCKMEMRDQLERVAKMRRGAER
jgi:hypothetical protein